jgi:hypothetical protein
LEEREGEFQKLKCSRDEIPPVGPFIGEPKGGLIPPAESKTVKNNFPFYFSESSF